MNNYKTAGRNFCSIISGDVSNCSYRLTVHSVASSRFSSANNLFYTQNPPKLSRILSRQRVVYLNDAPTGHYLASVEKGELTPSWLGTPTHRTVTVVGECVREWALHACMHHACVCDVFAIYDNNI